MFSCSHIILSAIVLLLPVLMFLIDGMRLKTEKYVPHLHINQCFRCQHRAMQCKKKERCGKCSDNKHTTVECQASKMKCTNCKGNHTAWIAECPAKTEESSQLIQMRREASMMMMMHHITLAVD